MRYVKLMEFIIKKIGHVFSLGIYNTFNPDQIPVFYNFLYDGEQYLKDIS